MLHTENAKRKIIMTCALPYANGPIHLGHMLEHIEADIYARFQKMCGHDCIFICADDTHGTPIMIKARELNVKPEDYIAQSFKEHTQDFKDFAIAFDHYGSTHSEENKNLSELFYTRLKAKGHIHKKPIEQLYCNHDKMFLPDRFVKGTCPKCHSPGQYGDSCDVCGATYSPSELKNPGCSICGNPPVKKESDHIFFKLNNFKEELKKWLPAHTAPEVSKKMMEWFNEDLRDWDISRDEPYFGFQIPGEPGKYFYVWVDAPMGYISAAEQYLKKQGRTLEEFWSKDSKTEAYHFIGKDIVYFHTLFWPALLSGADFRTPTRVNVHGHVMVNGEKMSKSKGTFINARTYLNHLDPQFLRYYYATKINGSVDDMDLNLDDFQSRVNSDLVGKIVNLGSRGAQMLNKKFGSKLYKPDDSTDILKELQSQQAQIAKYYDERDFSKATTLIRELAEKVNKYFDEKAPWKSTDEDEVKRVLTTTLNSFRILSIYLKPVLPMLAAKVSNLLNEPEYQWSDVTKILSSQDVNAYEHLVQRVDPEKVKAMIEEQKAAFAKTEAAKPKKSAPTAAAVSAAETASSGTISIEDFNKVDLRVAKVLEAETIPDAEKLLKLKVEIDNGQTRQIIAGIKVAYAPEKLIGRHVLICANLAPRKMKFGMSEGMVLCAGEGGSDLFVLSPDSGAKTGQKVK